MSNRTQISSLAPLASVQIEDFRGVRKLELELHPRVTVLFGSNAAGKTTILDAISIGLGPVVARAPRAEGRSFAKRGDIRVPSRDRPDIGERAGVERPCASVVVKTIADLVWGVTGWRSAADRKGGLAKVGPRALNQTLDPQIREALDAPAGSATAPIPLVVSYGNERAVVEIPLRERDFSKELERFGALDQSLKATTRFKAVFEWFRLMEDEERRQREKLRNFGFRLPELEWVRKAVADAELRIGNPRIETRPIRMLVDFEREDGETEVLDIKSLSDGYRTHFALIVDIARRMVQLNPSVDLADTGRGTRSPAVVLIDEVDLHLDPAWQARVVQGLLDAFPNAQFVLTTHSEQVIGSVEASQVRRLRWDNGEIVAETIPFAQGATGERILIELMGASERVKGPVTEKLDEYVSLVNSGDGQTQEALALRSDLDAAIPHDERLHQADLEMQRRDLLARFQESEG